MHENDELALVILIGMFLIAIAAERRWKPSVTAFGTARWASDALLGQAGMLGNLGLILGRTLSGKLIRTVDYCHILLIGSTGSGKGVSIIIPNLLTYHRGSVICVDIKGDLYDTCRETREAKGQRILRLAPFTGGQDTLNPLDQIPKDSPILIDSARALAESLVVRAGTEPDPHWNDKAAQVISAILVMVLIRFEGEERNLNSVQEIASDPKLLVTAADNLLAIGGIPARLGNQLKTLFDKPQEGSLSKEGTGVMSTVARHLAFLDSEPVARSVAGSSFDPAILLHPGTTLFLQIPSDQLEAQKGLFRCWMSSLVRMVCTAGDERVSEVLFLIDEASAFSSLSALEEALVRGRSSGMRLLLAYQSDSQVQHAFKHKPTLLYDNCTTQIYLGASSLETAERISKSLGEWTQVLEGYSHNTSRSSSSGSNSSGQSHQVNRGSSYNYSVNGRALLRPDEILTLSDQLLIVFQRGIAPILGQRVRWYQDSAFTLVRYTHGPIWFWLLLVAAALMLMWFMDSYGTSFNDF